MPVGVDDGLSCDLRAGSSFCTLFAAIILEAGISDKYVLVALAGDREGKGSWVVDTGTWFCSKEICFFAWFESLGNFGSDTGS